MRQRFAVSLQDQHVKENEDATFTCKVYPDDCHITWLVNAKEVTNSDKYQIDAQGSSRTLKIRNASLDDAGPVAASVLNLQAEAQLTVEGIAVPLGIIKLHLYQMLKTKYNDALLDCFIIQYHIIIS